MREKWVFLMAFSFMFFFIFSEKTFAKELQGMTFENAVKIEKETEEIEDKLTKNRKKVYYKIELEEKSILLFNLKSYIKKTTGLSLYNEEKELIIRSKANYNKQQEYGITHLRQELESGIYYIRIRNKNKIGKYNLTIQKEEEDIKTDENVNPGIEDTTDKEEENDTQDSSSSLSPYRVGGTYKVDMENESLLSVLQQYVPLKYEDGTIVYPQRYELYSENTAIINATSCSDNSIRFSKSPVSGKYEPVILNITYAYYTESDGFTHTVPVNIIITLEPM